MFREPDSIYYLSQVIGWIYFFAWSFSFYGQVIENYRRKSVSGLSFDFEVYNLTGFIGYSIYTIWGYCEEDIGTGTVAIQDIVFAIHAVVLTLITIGQIFIYYDKNDPAQKVSNTCKTITICLWWGVLQILLIERVLRLYDPHVRPGNKYIFNSVIYLGWCKVFISFIKYLPQVYSNYKRKSTIGWNIHNILLDFIGGSFSFIENILDSNFSITKEGQPPSLNIAKFALSILSMLFDIIFMVQHYILYPEKKDNEEDSKHKTLISDA